MLPVAPTGINKTAPSWIKKGTKQEANQQTNSDAAETFIQFEVQNIVVIMS